MNRVSFVLILIVGLAVAQRSPYAGRRPNGYKDKLVAATPNINDIGSRFGEGDDNQINGVVSSTPRIPIDALNDRDGYEIYNRQPMDKRPFWLINYQTIEAHRSPNYG